MLFLLPLIVCHMRGQKKVLGLHPPDQSTRVFLGSSSCKDTQTNTVIDKNWMPCVGMKPGDLFSYRRCSPPTRPPRLADVQSCSLGLLFGLLCLAPESLRVCLLNPHSRQWPGAIRASFTGGTAQAFHLGQGYGSVPPEQKTTMHHRIDQTQQKAAVCMYVCVCVCVCVCGGVGHLVKLSSQQLIGWWWVVLAKNAHEEEKKGDYVSMLYLVISDI